VVEGKPHFLTVDDLIPDEAIASSDDDEFHHEELARVIADAIALEVRKEHGAGYSGLNIALYGSWGAGKTGFFQLVKEILDRDCPNAQVVRYDAWKYDDNSLQRHFLTQVADALGEDVPDLYAVKEHKRLDPGLFSWVGAKRLAVWVAWWSIAALVATVAFVTFVGLVAAVHHGVSIHRGGIDHHGYDAWHHFWHSVHLEWGRFTTFLLGPAVALGVATGILRIVFEEALVTYRRDKPSEEEFEELFTTLLKKRREKSTKEGVTDLHFVFFIDELDRCGKTEVVATLHAIKNFLGKDGCVFVVAADRDVLEEALTELPQSNPTNLEAPYYSSASEYLDKIFHLQLALPPLRTKRRVQFARTLAEGRKTGLWADLERDGMLDDVLFNLIPQHVQSPRRIKTLLTSFALNLRAVQARKLDWSERAIEIAKLTAFQTEFPLFARDLPLEPRLPRWLLEPPGAEMSLTPQQKELLELHRLPVDPSESKEPDGADGDDADLPEDGDSNETPTSRTELPLQATDKILVSVSARVRDRLIREQRWQLRRYLEARRAFRDPRRDLLYLDSAGEFVGLNDTGLAITVEDDAPEDPTRVARALTGRRQEEIRASIKLMADLVPGFRGTQNDNLIRSVMGAVALLDKPVDVGAARDVASSLNHTSVHWRAIAVADLPLALEAALGADDATLVVKLLDYGPTLSTTTNVQRIATLYDRLREDAQAEVDEAVIEHFADDFNVLIEPVSTLPAPAAMKLLEGVFGKTVAESVASDEGENTELPAQLLDAGITNGGLVAAVAFRLLLDALGSSEVVYDALKSRGEQILLVPDVWPYGLMTLALKAFAQAPPSDWEFWLEIAEKTVGSNDAEVAPDAVAALTAFFNGFRAGDEDEQAAGAALVERLVAVAGVSAEDLDDDDLRSSIAAAIGGTRWSGDEDLSAVQLALHRAVRALHPTLPENVEEVLLDDLDREAKPPAPSPPTMIRPESSASVVASLAALAPRRSAEQVAEVISTERSSDPDRTSALLIVASSLADRGEFDDADWFNITPDEVVECVKALGKSSLEQWFSTRPLVDEVVQIATALGARRALTAVAAWTQTVSRDERTKFLTEMISRRRDASEWIRAIRDFDDVALSQHLARMIEREPTQPRRAQLVESLLAIGPSTPSAQVAAADALISLLNQRTKSDFAVAWRALPVLGGQIPRGKARALHNAISNTAKKHNLKVPAEAATKAGLTLSTRYVEKQRREKGSDRSG
jgi:hypothetical protein